MLEIQKQGQKIKRYFRPESVEEALALLNSHQSSARLIAGGTDLMIELDRGQRPGVSILIDISGIPVLKNIDVQPELVTLGAMVTHNDVVASSTLVSRALPLAQACWEVGSPQLRNRATIAGNVVTASPANDTITPLFALDAGLHIESVSGRRTEPINSFYKGVRKTTLAANELVTGISFKPLTDSQRGLYVKLGLRKAQAISVVHLAIILTFDDEIVIDSRITLGSVAPTIIRVSAAEEHLRGRPLDEAAIREAARAAEAEPRPIDDLRGTARYRSNMIGVMVRRALQTLAAGRERHTWPARPILLKTGGAPDQSESVELSRDTPITCRVNGHSVSAPGGAGRSLLHWLREEVRLPDQRLAVGTKEGCNEGECGSCTVFLNGEAVMGCLTPAGAAAGGEVVTIEGLAQKEQLHSLQQAFIETGAVQCGYCIPGFLMSGAKLLEEVGRPTEEQILQGMSGNLCRCTGYYKIIEAVHRAAEEKG